MLSRGALGLASPRVRRGMALSWSALFVLSLLLQYLAFAAAPAALAVHHDQFQLDGNAVDDAGSAEPDDWATLAGGGGSADAFSGIIHEPANSTIFTTGGSKDDLDTSSWKWTGGSVPDKDDLLDGFAAMYGHTIYFGADRFANNGDSAVGFWFFQNGLSVNSNGTFSPKHRVGDLFVVSHFENGGAVSEIQLYTWVGSGGSDGALDLTATGQVCTGSPAADKACGIANQDATAAPWPYTPKAGASGTFPQFSLYEGGLDLTKVFVGQVPCFSSFLVETRSSQEVNAQLKDFIAGDFNTCKPPTMATQVRQDGQSLGSVGAINMGESVTDHATFSGNDGAVEGTADFFLCGPGNSTPNCATGGTAAGSDTISGGAADSDTVTPTEPGFYCFRVQYTPAEGSQYLEGSHTNQTTECFQVLAANIDVEKTANPAGPVNAGDDIGFDIVVTNTGDGTAKNVELTDPLPAGISWIADDPTGDTDGVDCSIAAGTLTCTDAAMAAGDSFTVHIHGATDAADCGTVSNTASVSTSNDGSDESTATVDVLCAQISIEKVANPAGPVSAGDTIGFDITVTNDGKGTAHGVEMTDDLGSGWTADAPTGDTVGVDCSITSGTLTCTDDAMAAGESFTVHVHRATTADDCGTVNNTADVTTSNDGEDSASASVVVDCPDIRVTKTPDEPNNDIPAGQNLVFTIVVENIGDGTARDVHLTDVLPAGFNWAEDSAQCAITAGTLNCNFGDLDPGESATVHLTAPTSAVGENPNIDCSEGGSVDVPNVASATASNEGSDVLGNNSDPGDIDVLCSALVIDKSVTDVNDHAPVNDPDLGVPGTKIGDVVTFTLHYTGSGLLEHAFIVDVLPVGEEYVAGTASSNADFHFTSAVFNSGTKQWTLRWDATGTLSNPVDGTVTYDVKVLASAPDQPQPLVNEATIDSDQTNPSSDTARIAVAPPPQELTPPPTDVFSPATGTSNPGFALMLILLGVAGVTLAIGFVTPVPARARRRDR